MTLLGIDTETGGISNGDYRPSLLTLNMSIVDANFNIQEKLDLLLKPDLIDQRSNYIVQAEALKINGIDLIEHDLNAITYNASRGTIYKWLEKMRTKYGTLTPFGNCVQGDIDTITWFVLARKSWENLVDRRVIELTSIGKCLQMMGKIPEDQSLSLSNIADYFKIKVDSSLTHTADYDVWLGAQVMKKYFKMLGWK